MEPRSPDRFPKTPRSEAPKMLKVADILPVIPVVDGTTIVLQRNAKDDREDNSPDFGRLFPESAVAAKNHAKEYFDQIFDGLNSEEKTNMHVLVVASAADLFMPNGKVSPHKRGMETADQVIAGLQESMDSNDVARDQLLNKTGKPMELTSRALDDLLMIRNSPEFSRFLERASGGTGQKYWENYEDDYYKRTRQKMGAEGPHEIAKRVKDYLTVLSNAAKMWHEKHPGKRLIVWADSHYDNMSPFIKENVLGTGATGPFLRIENGGGMTIDIGKNGKATATVQNQQYDVPIEKPVAP